MKDPRLVANIMYEVATGQGRGRGNVRSTAGIRTWRTVSLSTGEAPAVSRLKQLPAADQWFRHDIQSLEHQEIEDVVDERA